MFECVRLAAVLVRLWSNLVSVYKRELEEEFSKIKQEMKRVTKSHSSLSSPRFVARRIGCNLLPRSSDAQADIVESTGPTPRASVEQAESSRHSRHRKSFSLF